jgi:hypothetical protein
VRRARLTLAAAAVLVTSLVLAAPAMARGTEGTYGKLNDKVVTNVGFLLIIFFSVLVLVLSIGQSLLERRKRSR